ncbi:MAG TPA: M48 family metallopeptidase, partial [Candidatus Nitrosopolaris sp.]|nr:M48 family metallopeptidase [Candidatus Nitrosopolaris sp.]
MNVYGLIVLAALLLEFALRVTADVLNLRALDPALPAEFQGIYDADRYARSQDYTRVRTRFGLLRATFDLALLIAFWFAGGFGWLDHRVRGLGLGPIASGLCFVAVLALARALVALPFGSWSTFVIEERFGFNRTTPRTFFTDLLKGLALTALLGGPLLAGILWLFERSGGHAWLWCWLVSTLVSIAVQFIAPTWIMPLFNRFTPLAAGGLREAILAYARSVDFPLQDIFLIDGSRRSTKANAFFTGFGRHRRIALFDTLLGTLDPGAVVAVVAHEVGHWKRGHVPRGMALGILHLGAMFLLLRFFLGQPALFHAFDISRPSPAAALVLLGLVLAPVELVLSIVLHAWSRHNEREADRFAVETTGDGPALARGLKRLSADS